MRAFFDKNLLLWLRGLGVFARALLFATPMCAFAPTVGHAQVQVFRCTVDGVVTFSDKPCGADARPYEVDDAAISTFTPSPVSATSKKVARTDRATNSSRESIAAAQAKHAETCARIEGSLRDIRAKMRAGYDAKQGERLNARERKLTAQRREQRC